MHTVDLGGDEVPVAVHSSGRKSLRLVMRGDQSLEVFVPRRTPLAHALAFVASKGKWILAKRAEMAARRYLAYPREFKSGEALCHLGRELRLAVLLGRGPAEILGERLLVRAADPADREAVARAVSRWQREEAREVFGEVLGRFLPRAGCPPHKTPSLAVRRMTSRWGSCGANGRIILNLQLVQCPLDCVEYVIMHELAHLTQHNHSPRFYQHLGRLMPDWRRRKAILDGIFIRQD